MNEYRKLLVLQYLNREKKNYRITEVFENLGLEKEIGDRLLDEMFEEKLIQYENYLITISEKGKNFLNKCNDTSFNLKGGEIFIHDLIPESQRLKEYDLYIPKKI